MYMGASFSETPFMGLSSVVVNGEQFTFSFIVDQSLPLVLGVAQQDNNFNFDIMQTPSFNFDIM
jgi:hypothetical protein